MIETAVPRLKSAYLSILEVGGAYGYLFRELIEFMGITTLIITDIDSVFGHAPEPPPAELPKELAERRLLLRS